MIAVFARANQPVGYAYAPGAGPIGSHGYSVIGIRCSGPTELQRVIEHLALHGCDLPDRGRIIYPHGKPARSYEGRVEIYDRGADRRTTRWYSGGPSDWDYLFTVQGDVTRASSLDEFRDLASCSLGDNRFTAVYDAERVLTPTRFDDHGRVLA